MEGSGRQRALLALGPALTLGTLFLSHFLWKTLFPQAPVIPGAAFAPVFLAIVGATFLGGRASGFLGAALATAYMAAPLPASFNVDNVSRVLLISGTLFTIVALVGVLKSRADASLDHQRGIAERERRNAREAEQANEALRANNETLETFVYVITHDLKEPVRAIEHHLQEAERAAETKEARAVIEEALDTNRRLGILLQRLLEYSRASLTTPVLRPLHIQEVLDDAVCRPIYEHTLRVRRARLDVSAEAPMFLGDPTLVAQAMGNLILNAVKHNKNEEPRVAVRLEQARPGMVDIVLRDNGPGFPEPLLTRFRALKPNRPATLSGGFGLVIAKRAIERLGGSMTIQNLAEGAEVRLSLPAAPSRRVEVLAAGAEAPGLAAS